MTCSNNQIKSINLSEKPEIVVWPETNYLGVEKVGSFHQTAPACWKELHMIHLSKLRQHDSSLLNNQSFSLFHAKKEIYVACAGCKAVVPSEYLVEGKESSLFEGGKYARFEYIGPFSGFGQAWGRVGELIKENEFAIREDAFYIEHYASDPLTTPKHELSTYLLVPIN